MKKDDYSHNFSSRFRVYPFMTAIEQLFSDVAIIYTKNVTDDENIQTLSGMISVGWNFIFRYVKEKIKEIIYAAIVYEET